MSLLDSAPWPACWYSPEHGIEEVNGPFESYLASRHEPREHLLKAFERTLRELVLGEQECREAAGDAQFTATWPHRWMCNTTLGGALVVVFPEGAPPQSEGAPGTKRLAVWFPQPQFHRAQELQRTLEEAQVHLELASRSLDVRNRLLTMITREIRTALSSICGIGELLHHRLTAEGDREPSRVALASPATPRRGSQSTSGGIASLAQQVVETARDTLTHLHSVATHLERPDQRMAAPLKLADMTRELIEECTHLLDGKPVRWAVALEPSVEGVGSDPLYMRLVLGQVLRQALLVAVDGSTIRVQARMEVEERGPFLRIEVINEEFGQVSIQPNALNPMCHEFLGVLGGELGCLPAGDRAASCYVRIPVLDLPARRVVPVIEEVPPKASHQTILVVEEDAFQGSLLTAMLHAEEPCAHVTLVTSLDAAESVLTAEVVTVFVGLAEPTRVGLRRMDAFRQRTATLGIPTVLIVSPVTLERLRVCCQFEAEGLLLRPFQRGDVARALRRARGSVVSVSRSAEPVEQGACSGTGLREQ